ncbi:uncharacterized protein NECHADRAFT_87938 [Fusarium vanettenii 77-13-4]|uniref:Heterokaryon incompatibility domain-containing protein n=1 Tax=Fusarium vanettenii (strain ATCC MYA-4622 / CBS 123669 / FGSC 9596 / NRRL 45880 / 77-13-4) TaxID=660122 RepID=C7ZJU5_FUSV7|nr:uncharacterized protein NECHADRAFT_87938 [Fusarium vanettenii 77-13-4]EEU35692.1 hypothetical protein NECHADRAFT_87938 [Fusarium vanettenii 77-13-4]
MHSESAIGGDSDARDEPNLGFSNNDVSYLIYEPLNPTIDEIRLLTLHPASQADSPLFCTLSHASLAAEIPAYEALSYVWGKPNLSASILLNDVNFHVTPSLASILSALRLDDQIRVLWIDALCINQSDVQERSQQVALMRKIYSCCRQDIAWLGELPDNDPDLEPSCNNPYRFRSQRSTVREGMEFMCQLTQKNPETLKSLRDKFDNLFSEEDHSPPRQDGFEHVPDLLLGRNDQEKLSALFRRPSFWDRLWIVQELSMAPHVVLMCEGAELNWDALSALFADEPYFDAFHTTDHHGGYRFFSSIFLTVKLVEDQRQLSSSVLPTRDESNLFDVLSRFRNLRSTDPRDKIYGLLGLVTQDHGIIVDYSKPLHDLYKEATLSIINLSKNLDIICQNPFEREGGPLVLGRSEDAAQAPEIFPSWTAEFHLGRPDCVSILFAQRGIFEASSRKLETPCRLLGPKKDVLILKGSVLGHIGPVLQGDSPNLNVRTEAKKIMRMYFGQDTLDDPNRHDYAPIIGGKQVCPKETLIRAYWRTLVKDCTAPPRMRRLLESEIESLNPINRGHLQAGQVLQTFQISVDESKSRSAFSYHPGKDSDFIEIEESKSLELTFLPWISYSNRDWMFTVADNGLFLLARPGVRQGDVIAVLEGAKIPMVLRRAEANHEHQGLGEVYQVVCSTYVHGFMDGEAERGVSEGWLEEKDFLIA